jgi:membrane protein DedA with SNARE-associated domain
VESVFAWLTGLPPAALYAALALAAALENLFPPLPADTVVAFGSFLSAMGEASVIAAFIATWAGNVTGAMAAYGLGRRYGGDEMRKRLSRFGGERAERQLEAWYERYGLLALFLSRFVPGVRALVPPFAGALGLRPLPVLLVIAVASGLWYGLVVTVAYRVGADWELLAARIGGATRNTALLALGIALALLAIWWIRRTLARREGA